MDRKTTTHLRTKNNSKLTSAEVRAFRKKVYGHYHASGRDLPWRKTRNPYRVLVSEIMLQQTQVERVIGKYREFLAAFPDFAALAQAPLPKLLVTLVRPGLQPPGPCAQSPRAKSGGRA